MAGLGQAPWSLWPVALAGYAGLLALMVRARRPGWCALAAGLGHFALVLHWITEPFLVDAAATGFLAPIALIGMALGMAIFWWAGLTLGARVGGALGAAAGLGLAELMRSYVLTGFPWALPGHVLIESPALPAAAWGGAHGLGLAVLLGAALVAMGRVPSAAAGVVVWMLPLGAGLAVPDAPTPDADAPVVRLIQPNAPQHLKWDPEWIGIFFSRGLELTARAGDVDVVVWPETAMPVLLDRSDDVRPMLARAAVAPVLIGVQRYGPQGSPRNAAALLTGPRGVVGAIYDKHRLVPFGEYLPFPALVARVGLAPLAAQLAGTFAAGPGPRTIDLPGIGPVLPLICYEAIFPQDLWRLPDRPRAILHLTNDAWFGTFAGPAQHLALARLRAAESGLPVLRAANTGVSAVIDARGGLRDALPLGVAGALDSALPPAADATAYGRLGDWPALAAMVALLATGIIACARVRT
ncbi:apolipoprotein N-acyltransferase [Jannaschia sp. LMIT008]|uniref:apolipoprotein N-acyltransferase n=1 Tax=Jannaschia maritima TaxID=3032585 RepID=UPI00281119E8|nr:apolipoprotein N-acyltransferase [Jannaschia sp. LMIT008]